MKLICSRYQLPSFYYLTVVVLFFILRGENSRDEAYSSVRTRLRRRVGERIKGRWWRKGGQAVDTPVNGKTPGVLATGPYKAAYWAEPKLLKHTIFAPVDPLAGLKLLVMVWGMEVS